MPNKLSRKIIPSGHALGDFECFGPPALKDGEFEGTMIADFGCFNQDGKDSNKLFRKQTNMFSRKNIHIFVFKKPISKHSNLMPAFNMHLFISRFVLY